MKAHEVAELLKPYVVKWINEAVVTRGTKAASSGEVSGGGVVSSTVTAQTGNTTTGARHTHQVDAVSSVLTPSSKLLKSSASGYLNVIRLGVNRVPEVSLDACGGLFVRGNESPGSGSGTRVGYFNGTGYVEARLWSGSTGIGWEDLDLLGADIHLRANGHASNGIYVTKSGCVGLNSTSPTHVLTVDAGDIRVVSGSLVLNDTSNANNTLGLTINQGAIGNEIISLKSNVSHGMTTITEDDTYSAFTNLVSTCGGLLITGLSTGSVGMQLRGVSTASTGGRGTAANAPIVLRASYKSGTSAGSFPANANLLVVRDDTLARLILDSDGDLHLDAAINASAYDTYDDVGLLTGLRASLTPDNSELRNRFSEWIEYAREPLEKTGILTYNDDGHHFIAMKKLAMLQIDAIRQLSQKVIQLETKVLELTSACTPLLP